ncbi:hypothetical protein AOQ73_39325 [Bradyrhizobium pachyrhizi]|nr:hypothetical protein AOQ73_39325 [Bradyrhizobium pachyrhizi]
MHGDLESKLALSDRSGFYDGKRSAGCGLASFRGTALQHNEGAQVQHVETLLDFRLGEAWVERNRDATAGDCDDGENRLRAVRHQDPDPGITIETGQAQPPADRVQLAFKTVVCQRLESARDDRRLVRKPTGSSTYDLAYCEPGFRLPMVASVEALGTHGGARRLVVQKHSVLP